jgi:arylamine N-acetyltransferase
MKTLKDLEKFNSDFLRIPYENISKNFLGRPPKINEINEFIKIGLGGDCISLSRLANYKLRKRGFKSYIINFLDNHKKEYDNPRFPESYYHTSLIVEIGRRKYLLDYGFQTEKPILIKNDHVVFLSGKEIKINIKNNKLFVSRKSAVKDHGTIVGDLNKNWSDEDMVEHSLFSLSKDLPLRYSRIDRGKKKAFLQKGNIVEVIEKVGENTNLIFSGTILECSDFIGINKNMMKKALENYNKFH